MRLFLGLLCILSNEKESLWHWPWKISDIISSEVGQSLAICSVRHPLFAPKLQSLEISKERIMVWWVKLSNMKQITPRKSKTCFIEPVWQDTAR